ncbi:MAG: glycosyltransferase family 2 protein [Gaiellaceae bacterium]
MSANPFVSVVMPVYNAEKFLPEALESVLAQDYAPFEVIVIDDGSTDGTAQVVERYPEVTCIRQENAGASAARNTGIAAATGEWVANVDGDDWVPSTKLTVQMGYVQQHPEVVCVLGRQEWIDPPPWLVRDPVYGELDGIPLNSMVARRDVLLELGGHDDAFGGDLDVLVKMRENGYEYAVIPEIVVFRRYHGENLVASKPMTAPLPLISLKAKLDRERARAGGSA